MDQEIKEAIQHNAQTMEDSTLAFVLETMDIEIAQKENELAFKKERRMIYVNEIESRRNTRAL